MFAIFPKKVNITFSWGHGRKVDKKRTVAPTQRPSKFSQKLPVMNRCSGNYYDVLLTQGGSGLPHDKELNILPRLVWPNN